MIVKKPAVYWPVLIILFILLSLSIVHLFGEQASPYGSGDEEAEVPEVVDYDSYSEGTSSGSRTRETEGLKAMVSPKMLGAIIVLIMVTLAIALLSKS